MAGSLFFQDGAVPFLVFILICAVVKSWRRSQPLCVKGREKIRSFVSEEQRSQLIYEPPYIRLQVDLHVQIVTGGLSLSLESMLNGRKWRGKFESLLHIFRSVLYILHSIYIFLHSLKSLLQTLFYHDYLHSIISGYQFHQWAISAQRRCSHLHSEVSIQNYYWERSPYPQLETIQHDHSYLLPDVSPQILSRVSFS